MNNLLSKAEIFYELFSERFQNIQKVKILFFYDVIPKEGYDKKLKKILNDFFEGKEYLKKKVQFQITFITSSYFAHSVKVLIDNVNSLDSQLKGLKNENESLHCIVNELTARISTMEKKVSDLSNRSDTSKRKDSNEQENASNKSNKSQESKNGWNDGIKRWLMKYYLFI